MRAGERRAGCCQASLLSHKQLLEIHTHMALLIPGIQAVLELKRTHERTFAIEPREDEPFVLYLKLTPTQTLSIINGAPIGLVIGCPAVEPNTLSFTLHDVVGTPFFISKTWNSNSKNSQLSEAALGLPPMFEQLAQASQIQIGLFDWNIKCVYTEIVQILKPKQSVEEWIDKCLSTNFSHIPKNQVLEYGYSLELGPLSQKSATTYKNYNLIDKLGDKPYVLTTNKYTDHLSVTRYLEEGKHGYYQEHVLTTIITRYFQSGGNLFISPRTRTNIELADFVIADHGTIVLIESKASRPYEGTPRKPRTVESSFTRLISKAFEQLHRAKEVVAQNPAFVEDIKLREYCESFTNVICICIVDDAWMINARMLEESLNIGGKEMKGIGVYILEIEDFFGLLANSPSTESLIKFLLQLSMRPPSNGSVPLFNIGF